MDLTKIRMFSALTQRMAWLRERQTILAQNIANADTPGYTARDLKPQSFRDMVRPTTLTQLNPRVTAAGHQLGGHLPQSEFRVKTTDASAEPTLTGNAVDLEQQIMKVSETSMDYQTMTNLYRKHVDMLRSALGRGR
jgi:flagellar basal-body rod protein FlgB